MAKKAAQKKQRARASVLTKLLILVLLVGLGVTLHRQQARLETAQAAAAELHEQVESLQQKNDALASDIEEGTTQEKMEELARDQLGMVAPGERVFYPTSN